MQFEGITFVLKERDIIDCVVYQCQPECLYAKLGPVEIVVPRDDMPNQYEYSEQVTLPP